MFYAVVLFQNVLAYLCSRCAPNSLILNVNNCSAVTYYRKSNSITGDEVIASSCFLLRMSNMHDLGVVFYTRISLNLHLDYIVSKAYSILGIEELVRSCRTHMSYYNMYSYDQS